MVGTGHDGESEMSPKSEDAKSVHAGFENLPERPGHILIVDDDEWNCELLSQGLALEGLTSAVARDGQKALEMVGQLFFDLVLLDISMPKMSGLQVLETLRKSYTLTELPVIMVTAQEGSESIAKAMQQGANDYVTKPLDMVVLLARIKSLLTMGQLERRLREEKSLVDSVIQSAHEMIISVDMTRRITVFNKAAERTFGYSKDEVVGRHVDMLYADPQNGMEVHQKSVRENGFSGEVLNRRKNGEVFLSGLSVSVLFDQQGKPRGVMGISTDITEQKKLETERENLAKLKDEFLRIASHDLKNPVAAIYGLSRVLQGFVTPGTQMTQEYFDLVRQIETNANFMRRIIGDFLDFHAMEDGKLALDLSPTNLNQIASEVVEANLDYAEAKGVRLEFISGGDIAPVSADPARIHQVIQNLVGNAIKFCPEGSLVWVKTSESDEHVFVEIQDTGPGLTEEDMQHVFRKYTRLSNKPTGGESSSGLGLAICKQLVDMHKGSIGVRNNPEGGATFWLSLPALMLDSMDV